MDWNYWPIYWEETDYIIDFMWKLLSVFVPKDIVYLASPLKMFLEKNKINID